MSTSIDAHQLSTLLRISSELDIVGDVTATVTTPSELLAWAHALPEPTIRAWRPKTPTTATSTSAPPATVTPSMARSPPYSPATPITRSGPLCCPRATWPPARKNSCRSAR